MLQKAFLYDKYSGVLHRCMLVDADKWMTVEQGQEPMILCNHPASFCEPEEEFHLLCLEGEKVESLTIAKLLGCGVQADRDVNCLLKKQLAKLTKWGVEWLHDSLEMKVQLLEHFNPKENEIRYRFFISCAETRFLAKANNFSTIDELMACVRQYFEALEVNAGISVTSKKLETNERLLAMVSQKDREMFIIK